MQLSALTLALTRIGLNGDGFSPISLFTTGEQGLWHDPSDFSTMFQDAAATIPVTAVEQPVGLILDKRNGELYYGPEQVVNGNFPVNTDGWSVQAGGTLTWTATGLQVSGANLWAYQSIPTEIGKRYICSYTPGSNAQQSNLALGTSIGNSSYLLRGSPIQAPYSFVFVATTTTTFISFRTVINPVIYTGFSIKESNASVNIVTNPTLASFTGSSWSVNTGWVIGSGVATKTAGTASSITQSVPLRAGRTYRIVYTITRTAGSISPRFSGGTTVSGTAKNISGTYVEHLTALTGNNLLEFAADATFAGTLDNVYMQEVTGNDGYQETSASRPTLKALYNKVINSGFSGATTGTPGTAPTAWAFGGSTGTTDSVSVSDDAGGFRITYSATAARQYINQTLIPIAANEIIDSKITIYANTGLTIAQSFIPQSFPVGAVATYFANGVSVASTYVPVANDVITARLTNSTTAGTFLIRIGVGTNAAATGTITFGKCDVRSSNDGVGLPAYQFVNTDTDYDSTGFPPYLSFDGTNDYLACQPISLASGDDALIVAGQRKLKDGTSGPLVASYLTDNPPTSGYFTVFCPSDTNSYRLTQRGSTSAVFAGTGTFAASPNTGVVTGIASISDDLCQLRLNAAVIETTTTDQGTGNYNATSGFSIGRQNVSYFQGRLYNLVVRMAASTPTQITNTENYVNSKTKAY